MTVKEFLELCPETRQDKTTFFIYYDFHGRKKNYSLISVHEENIKLDHEDEWISIRFDMPNDGEIDESDTMSIAEFTDFCNKNNVMEYLIEFLMNDGIFIHSFIPDKEDIYIPEGFDCVCLCY